MPPIHLREGLAFPRDVPSAKHEGHPKEKTGLSESGLEAYHSLKLEGQGRHVFSCPLDAGRHGFSCTSPCFQFIMED